MTISRRGLFGFLAMGGTELSQISAASNPQFTDTVIGVQGGTTEVQYTFSQLGVLLPATGFLNFYISTTGSDSNPGTLAQPFATLQHAFNIALKFDYQGLYFPTFNVENGTYAVGALQSVMYPFFNTENLNYMAKIIGNSHAPANVVTVDSFDFELNQAGQSVVFDGFTLNKPVGRTISDITLNGGSLFPGSLNYDGGGIVFLVGTPDAILNAPGQLTFTGSSCVGVILSETSAVIWFNATVVFPASYSFVTGFVKLINSVFQMFNTTWTNFAGVTGFGVNLAESHSSISTDTGNPAVDIPGTAGLGNLDASTVITTRASTISGQISQTLSGIPTTSNLAPRSWTLFKDTSGGGVYLVYNDAGAIKKVALT
jgi:hypothetical protein